MIGISVDPVEVHRKWKSDIEKTSGHKVDYPMIGDPDLKVAKLYDMLPAEETGTSEGRTPAQNETVRSVFVVELGRASCRERVCQYVWISVVAGSLTKKNKNTTVVCKYKN